MFNSSRTVTLVFIFKVILFVKLTQCIDYCDPNLCDKNEKHIACNNNGVC